MATIGVVTLELRIEEAHSLKEKRHVVKSLKDRLRRKFNVSVAEIDDHGSSQQRGAGGGRGVAQPPVRGKSAAGGGAGDGESGGSDADPGGDRVVVEVWKITVRGEFRKRSRKNSRK